MAFVPHGKVGEDEVASRLWAFQVNHTSNRGAGKNGRLVLVGHATSLGDVARGFQSREQEVVGVHGEGDVLGDVVRLELQDLQLDDWWRVNRSAIG